MGNYIHLLLAPLAIVLLWISKKIIIRLSKIDATSILLVCITLLVLPLFNIGKIVLQEQKIYEPKTLKIPETAL